jgi:hypothetical protein
VTFTGTGGGPLDLSASAVFTVTGTTLTVTLTNTSSSVSASEAQVLTAVFFDAPAATTRTSALLAPGSFVINDSPPPGDVVGGEWAYRSGIVGPNGATSGISSASFGLFPSTIYNFPGPDLYPPLNPDGQQYGIVSASTTTYSGGVPMINHSVVFVLDGFTGTEADIANVSFQFGSSLGYPNVVGTRVEAPIPEPGAALLFGVGTCFAATALRRRAA